MNRIVELWETVQVVPVAGFVNVYETDDGHIAEACPAFLLQQHRANVQHTGKIEDRTYRAKTTPLDTPYTTRVVAAIVDYGAMDPAEDISRFVEAMPRAEFEERYGKRVCPVCDKPAILVAALDRYVHMDGSANDPCWRPPLTEEGSASA
ncbi:hypothetical protein AB0L97_20210 [Nocardia sp. NPDC051911]|uniref:hypothetical protein n=1 Tax=Nocardia sp. NPDC051911 TaxID=3154648 RepID=UPI00341C05D1